MSEGDVSLIHDEDVLRRMWQQTEDFSRKKEIRAHMYRLREERLRNLYSPEPHALDAKGDWGAARGHGCSFADQSFQSLKSKEVRDAGSPPKEFYSGQDLKELSNAGWNVESENNTINDGHTHVKSVNANIEGHFDVEGGRGQFAAVDEHRQATTQYQDDTSSLRRDESSSNTAAHEQVVRQSDDGSHFSSTKTSSSSSKFKQTSSTMHESVPYTTNDDYAQTRQNYDSSNLEETSRKVTKTDYDQSLRNYGEGELVSRKVEYPDSNTKVTVETRELPDGTRVTSTRREHRAPAASTAHSEQHSHQTRTENKSTYASSKQDVRELTSNQTNEDSKITNIVDAQRKVDDCDFKRNHTDISKNERKDHVETIRQQRCETNVNETDRREVTSQDSQRFHDTKIVDNYFNDRQKIHEGTTDIKEEIVEKKTSSDQYQTTYQSDFSQNKISQDLSPTHQAWASSLRADTPSRPTTRASSPGSRTYQSSTSSLRSSVSPDKVSKKPPSRGGSPSKIDISSPSGTTTNRYHSTHTVTDTKTNKFISPDRKSSQHSSPTRHGISPDRKPHDNYRQRPSVSPEKRSQEATFRPSISPERSHRSNPSPSRTSPVDREGSLTKPYHSPENKPYHPSSDKSSPTVPYPHSNDNTDYPKAFASKPSQSPDRKPGYQTPSAPTRASPEKSLKDATPTRSSVRPERKPGYMRPTASKPDPASPEHSPSKSPDRKPYDHSKTTSVKEDHYKFIDEETKMYTRANKTNVDYTKQSTRSDTGVVLKGKSPSPIRKVPIEDAPDYCPPESLVLTRPSLRKDSRSPSPPKGPVTFSQNRTDTQRHDTINKTKKYESVNISTNDDHVNRTTESYRRENSPTMPKKDIPSRDSYPSKYGTHESKTSYSEEKEDKTTIKTNTDVKYDSLTRRETTTKKSTDVDDTKNISHKVLDGRTSRTKNTPTREPSPSKYGTYEKKNRQSEDVVEVTKETTKESKTDSLTRREKSSSPSKIPESSSNKNFPRVRTLPTKSPVKENTYSHTTDFITSEITTEETNKKTVTRDRSRQLITPSTSPTRKPQPSEPEPSTGQSSPTTSVSGFIYFSSPPLQKTIVTDLDDAESYFETNTTEQMTTTYKRPEDLPLNRSPSPSKIPCRSPSPEKKAATTKQTLPRKSSLKKPSTLSQVSPTEKPPSTFRVSPNIEIKDLPEHKVVKKDNPEKPDTTSPMKVKPPFERRETYEERCRKILGMMKDTNKTTSSTTEIDEATYYLKEPESSRSSPSVSPCPSPGPKECSPVEETYKKEAKDSITKVTDNISHEKEDLIKNTQVRRGTTPTHKKSNTPSRESSPTKLQDIISKTTSTNSSEFKSTSSVDKEKTINDSKVIENKTKSPRSSVSPLRRTPEKPTNASGRSDSPTKILKEPKSRTPSPIKKSPDTLSSTNFINSEREIKVLDRVQKSLRNLSPNRTDRSPSREMSPGKTTTSLQDIDITSENTETCKSVIEKETVTSHGITSKGKATHKEDDKTTTPTETSKTPKVKPQSRTVSPVKKAPVKARSISPRKPVSSIDHPQSTPALKTGKTPPQFTRKPTPTALNVKTDSTITSDVKKSTGVTKQNSFTKTSPTKIHRIIPSPTRTSETDRRVPAKGSLIKENVSPRKEDIKVTRTTSDISIKIKKPPQRIKSKPEIQVNDMSTKTKQTSVTKIQKPTIKEPHMILAAKPKSATALNTSIDEDDVLIDVELAKSSRENSPDRICPTPIGFLDDIQTPRLPDEVSEPDDEFRKRTHHTIHETESLVDDIIEISEDDELFVKRTQADHITESDECLLSVNDKVSKFTNKIENVVKPKDTTRRFKDTEKRVHSDFVEENLKSDECLLSVSEKVNKFAKGPRDTKDSRSPSRRVTDEYDVNTVYQDDYTKLSVNDKAHLFIETAENVKTSKTKPLNKINRPDFVDIDESLKTDDCLLSVSDKVNKFVKTAEHFLQETINIEEKERKIKEQHEEIMRKITEDENEDINVKTTEAVTMQVDKNKRKPSRENRLGSFSKETTSSQSKSKDYTTPDIKQIERIPAVKITTLRSSEAVKKAKALFENIATIQKSKESVDSKTHTKTAKLTDIGVIKKSPKTDSTIVLHPSLEDGFPSKEDVPVYDEVDCKDRPSSGTLTRPQRSGHGDYPRDSPARLAPHSPQVARTKSPIRQTIETATMTTRTVIPRQPTSERPESPIYTHNDVDKSEKHNDKVPGYQRPTQTSQIRDEKRVEEVEVSSRRGSGKFGVELRRTSVERRTAAAGERRRSSLEPHQPCIEDVFDLDLLEQMLEKVVGYEQRRRIRAQIRVTKKKMETEHVTDTKSLTKTTKHTFASTPKTRSPERQPKSTPVKITSPERHVKTATQKTVSPDRNHSKQQTKPILNGHANDPVKIVQEKHTRPISPEKFAPETIPGKTRSPVRQRSPEKKARPLSPSKTTSPQPKGNRFNEYATAYMKKVGLNESEKLKFSEVKNKRIVAQENQKNLAHSQKYETKHKTTTNTFKKTLSNDGIEVRLNGKRSPSPGKGVDGLPEERLHQRSPSPEWKIPRSDVVKKETIIKTTYEVEKNPKQEEKVKEEKPSWVTSRNLKKVTAESRSFSGRRLEDKSRSSAKAVAKPLDITKPLDVITSSYGPGPRDADGRPLFGIKALRNGASNYQVKGTVVREEYRSQNGGPAEGSVQVTAYSTEPEALAQLLRARGGPPSRLHGLAAVTTAKRFGGDTGTSREEAHTKEERAALEQFTHSDRRVTERADSNFGRDIFITDVTETEDRTQKIGDKMDKTEKIQRDRSERISGRTETISDITERKEKMGTREDRKTVRQSSVKSLTEKYIKSASDTTKSERSAYPKAGLILRAAGLRDSSSDSSQHAGLARTDSEHSLGSVEEAPQRGRVTTTTTVTTTRVGGERSFLDSNTKVTGVQDILTRMKNADIVIEDGDTSEDTEARALLNKFLGATVLMAGMKDYVAEAQKPHRTKQVQETVRSVVLQRVGPEFDPDQCWDERLLKKLLEESTDYEQRRRLRARIRTLMAEQEACASAVTEALAASGEGAAEAGDGDAREEKEVTTVTSSVRRNSSEKSVSSSTTTRSSKVIESVTRPAPKPASPFAKFRQLEKQNSTNSPNSPKSPQSPGSPSQPFFKFTDPALQASALTIKERLLQWCRDKTRDYENVKLENFSTSWADGLAFCALVHHFLPDAFDYSQLTPDKRRHNFTLAFKVADEKAGIYPLLDVDDMVAMRKPDWKCVFTYVQAIHRRFKDER